MRWRVVVIKSRAKLETQFGNLVVRTEADVRKVFLDEIATLMVESTAVSLTAALLAELCSRKINVIFCDKQRNPLAEVAPYYGCHDTSEKVRKQVAWQSEAKVSVWTRIIRRKIENQACLLKASNPEQASLLTKYVEELAPGDPSNREGHAAKVYFNALFGKGFSREKECATNAALDYGYAILLSALNREICAAGYITQLGIGHGNVNNRFNLGCDLIEPLRPIVDKQVLALKVTQFGKDEKMALVNIMNKDVRMADRTHTLNNAIKPYADSVFDALNAQDADQIRFISDEL